MTKMNPLKQIVIKQKQGEYIGIYSCCSANAYVIEAVLDCAKRDHSCALIEATANQVDQYGGYTGMTPKDFKTFVYRIADKVGIETSRIFLGGDHLGPLTFAHLPESEAMKEACELVRSYVAAGFTKIHIDTSMKVASDLLDVRLSDTTIAARGAQLARVCEDTYLELSKQSPNAIRPVYIVGSEVPIPGGAQDDDASVQVTKVEDFKATVTAFETAFANENLQHLWQDVIGVVVQPGVEEADTGPKEYNREEAKDLMASIQDYPNLVFEGHSTDYQTKQKLKELVEDGVGILKVGPGLSFAMREGVFALSDIEQALYQHTTVPTSHIKEVLEEAMLHTPKYWQKHYHGDEATLARKRKYSFSDRCRYYFPEPSVQNALELLFENLSNIEIPLSLLSQYMPIQYTKVREGNLCLEPLALLKDRIVNTIDEYLYATQQEKLL